MDASEFRRLGHRLVDLVAEYREGLEERPVMSQVAPGAIRARFPAEPPRRGGGAAAALDGIERDLMPGITHWNHPSFFAYFPANATYASVLGDLLAAGLGAQGMSWQTSPALTELEEVVMGWLRRMVGLPEGFAGVVQDTASTATLTALLCARERSSGFAQERGGLQARGAPLLVYASDQAHSSVEKAALLAGFGREHLRVVPTGDDCALRLDLLEEALRRDLAAGGRPCALVATTGTTATAALDPVAGMADLAARHGTWLHVDAAMAGTAMVLPECRWMWAGVERADSVVFNPHKWMGIGFDFSAYLVRDPEHLVRVMGMNPSYLRTEQDGAVRNLRDWGIPLGRRFRALKGWLVLLDEGVDGIAARIRRDLENAQWLREQVDAAPGWERLAPVHLQTVCLRHLPPGGGGEPRIAAHNLALADRLNRSGRAYLTPAVVKGRQLLRVSVGAARTERRHLEALWGGLQEVAAAVD
ncbi:MAG TPA: pyridoxal-dependent decarboxylase [Anaeromyxobacteraceae bacterium]|jgi:aromatic-L-amino-acid decarboxylase